MKAKRRYVTHITGKDRKLLKKIYRRCKGKESYRSHIILLATDVVTLYTIAQIAAICYCCRQTVYNTIASWNEYGLIGIVDKTKSGRPRIIKEDISEEVFKILEERKPCEMGNYIHSKWTLKIIKDYVKQTWQIKASQRTISRWLRQNKWSFQRSKRELLPPGPLSEETQNEVVKLLEEIDESNEVILFLDQSAFYLDGLCVGTWMPMNTQKEIYVSGNKDKFWIFGVFNPHTKKVYYRICDKCNSIEMVLFLIQIRQRYPGKTIHLVLDNASFHKSAETDYYLYYHPEFKLHFLPTRGTKLNPIERFWLFAKGVTVANAILANLDELYHVLRRFFWHYNEGNIEYNYDLEKTIKLWKRWPTVPDAYFDELEADVA